ncbi:hypothetical protein PAPHI01_0992 [Pancytospora philotis]|nr:hypothetical protein PAPHI01_0992 [Pancytospora philotis]
MADLSDFQPSAIKRHQYETVLAGTLNGAPAILKVKAPQVCSANIGELLRKPHATTNANGIYETASVQEHQAVPYTLVCPAAESDFIRFGLKTRNCYVTETYEEYLARPVTPEDAAEDHYCGETPTPTVYHEDEEFLVTAHPCWDGEAANLWLVLALKDERYRTVRELDSVAVLKRVKEAATSVCAKLGIPEEHVCVFTRLSAAKSRLAFGIKSVQQNTCITASSGWILTVDTLIKNLEIDPDYYKGTINYIQQLPAE